MDFAGDAAGGDGTSVIGMSGELDLGVAAAFGRALLAPIRQGRDVVIDLSDVTFVDSSGLSAVLEAVAAARESGTGIVAVVDPAAERVTKVLQLTGADTVMSVVGTVDEAEQMLLAARGGTFL